MLISRDKLREALPRPLLSAYRVFRAAVNRWQYRGRNYYCNVCDSQLREWVYAGPLEHKNLICPVCYSFGRHRLMALVIEREIIKPGLAAGCTLLHFSPEVGLQRWVLRQANSIKYLSSDFYSPDADLQLDLQRIELPGNVINYVVLSHVLEHVDDDLQALKELYRILAPNGKLFIQVPLSGAQVTQDKKLTTPTERLASYGKTDHVRLYGGDILSRLAEVGFSVTVHKANEDPYKDKFNYLALDLPGDSAMLYENESTTFVCSKRG